MRRFRFVGDARFYEWDEKPVYGKIYDGDFCWTLGVKNGDPLETWYSIMRQDWQEVFDEPKPLHKDTDLGYFSGLAMQAFTSNPNIDQSEMGEENIVKASIILAKELIKQLDSSNNPASD